MPNAHRQRPDQRANDRQRESVRAELHTIVDNVVGAWPTIIRQANEMSRGIPSLAGGAVSGGDVVDPTSSSAFMDPSVAASEWLVELREACSHLKRLDRKARQLLPLQETEIERGRVNTVENCAECGEPAPKVKRLDGEPYHPGACWMRAYRRMRPETA